MPARVMQRASANRAARAGDCRKGRAFAPLLQGRLLRQIPRCPPSVLPELFFVLLLEKTQKSVQGQAHPLKLYAGGIGLVLFLPGDEGLKAPLHAPTPFPAAPVRTPAKVRRRAPLPVWPRAASATVCHKLRARVPKTGSTRATWHIGTVSLKPGFGSEKSRFSPSTCGNVPSGGDVFRVVSGF